MEDTLRNFASEALKRPRSTHSPIIEDDNLIVSHIRNCYRLYSDENIEISDPDCIGKGHKADNQPVAYLKNPNIHKIHHLDLDTYLKKMAKRQDNLPSCCDCMLWTENQEEVILSELTASLYRYIDDTNVNYTDLLLGKIPKKELKSKRAKAFLQLRNSIDILGKTQLGNNLMKAHRKTAVFFFRRTDTDSIAGKSARAFSRVPSYTKRLVYPPDGNYPDWTFFSQPSEQFFIIQ